MLDVWSCKQARQSRAMCVELKTWQQGMAACSGVAIGGARAEKIGALVVTTFKAMGLVPDDHTLGAGVLGRSGTPIASWFMNEADVLTALGASFSNHTGIALKQNIIQVDYDRMQLGKFHAVNGRFGRQICTIRPFQPSQDSVADMVKRSPKLKTSGLPLSEPSQSMALHWWKS